MIAEKIRIVMLKKKVTLKELAKHLGCTSQNLSMKFARDDLRESEIVRIAEYLGCRFDGKLVIKETGEEI